jgi:hypothetical protein
MMGRPKQMANSTSSFRRLWAFVGFTSVLSTSSTMARLRVMHRVEAQMPRFIGQINLASMSQRPVPSNQSAKFALGQMRALTQSRTL